MLVVTDVIIAEGARPGAHQGAAGPLSGVR